MGEVYELDFVKKYKDKKGCLIEALQDVQEKHNYLPRPELEKVSEILSVPINQIYSIATFYRAFSLKPRGKHQIHVCMGTACHVKGAPRIIEQLERELNVKCGETTEDMNFTLEDVRCIGCCSIAPAVRVGEDTYGRIKSVRVKNILKKYKKDA